MKVGTKSILFGAHQFLLHPFFVWRAWCKLYGFTLKPQILVACITHDWGYWGRPNMDGPEGEDHPYLGARIMHWLFDRPVGSCRRSDPKDSVCYRLGNTGCWYWYNFTLTHSRSLASKLGLPYSKLCVADKLVPAITPWWLYLPFVVATGEIEEYMHGVVDGWNRGSKSISDEWCLNTHTALVVRSWKCRKLWFKGLQEYMATWVEKNKEGARS